MSKLSHSDHAPSRRELLKQGATIAAAMAVSMIADSKFSPARQPAAVDLTAGLIDAHSHVWTPDLGRYPLAAPFKLSDMAPASFTPEELLAHARPCGVSRVVLIQMSYYGFDNRYMLDCMKRFPGVFAGVAVVDEHAAGLGDTMRGLKKVGVRGFRIHPGEQLVDRWLGSPGMAQMWTVGADEQLAMCGLINPEALPAFDRMCEKFPLAPVVIDHFARIGVDGMIREADVANLCRLARHRHTHVKISAFYALGKKKSPYMDLAPTIRALVNAFGPERLMWATDCPYQVQAGHTYLDSVELVRSRLDFLSDSDRQWLLKKTAERVFFS